MHRLYLQKYEPHIRLEASDDDNQDDGDGDDNHALGPERKEQKQRRFGGCGGGVGGGGGGGGGGVDDQEEQDDAQEDDDEKPQVTYDFYNERFRRFDLSFATPLVDSCATCDELQIQIAAADDENAADALRAKRRAHLLEADRGYAMRKHDQELAQESRKTDPNWKCPADEHRSWDATEFVSSDMAGVLSTPKVPTSKAFYLRKLKTYCYGLFSGQADQNTMCFYDETIANKGCNEVISCAQQFFTLRRTGATHLCWWGDNTSSQMKNQFLMLYANELVRDDGFSFYHRIDNKYSPPGHT
jgi:hypothetical protein